MNAPKKSPNARQQSRVMLMEALYAWQLVHTPVDQVALDVRTRAEQEGLAFDAAYFHSVLDRVVAIHEHLDAIVIQHSSRDGDTIHPIERVILWIAACELKERLDVPYKVIINEALNLSKTYGSHESHRFVNAVLDRLARDLRPASFAP